MSSSDAVEIFSPVDSPSTRRRRSSGATAEEILRSKIRQSPRQRSPHQRSRGNFIDLEENNVDFNSSPQRRRSASSSIGRNISRQNSFGSGSGRQQRRYSRESIASDRSDDFSNNNNDDDDNQEESCLLTGSRSQSAKRRSSKSRKSHRRRVSFSDPLIDPKPEIRYSCTDDATLTADDNSLTREDTSLSREEMNKMQADLTAEDSSDRVHPRRMLKRGGSYSKYKRRHGWRRFLPWYTCVHPEP